MKFDDSQGDQVPWDVEQDGDGDCGITQTGAKINVNNSLPKMLNKWNFDPSYTVWPTTVQKIIYLFSLSLMQISKMFQWLLPHCNISFTCSRWYNMFDITMPASGT
jgi:hypothetical protein